MTTRTDRGGRKPPRGDRGGDRLRDCDVVILVKLSMSALPSTPVYFATTGTAACSVTASRWALTEAHTFSPSFRATS
jgi:hypothetical protein